MTDSLPYHHPHHGVRHWPLTMLGLVMMAFILMAAAKYRPIYAAVAGTLSSNQAVSVEGSPPTVEPLELLNVSPLEAKQKNDEVPFTTDPVPAAAPFIFKGSTLDMARAVDCLAATIYYEAGNEAVEGQMAVVQVVLNRARHPAYPSTVCGVVFQGQERRTGCQFSYTCDGSMVRRKPDPLTWERFRALATSMLTGTVYAPVGWATHYHTDWVIPKWSAKLDKITAERSHLFFRWHGFWGTPKAFKNSISGIEPSMEKLAALSPAHNGGGLADIDLSDVLAKELGELGILGASVVIPDAERKQFIILVDETMDAAALTTVAEQTCGLADYCKVLAWTDVLTMPQAFPVTDAQLSTIAFSYLRNRAEAFEKPLWNCNLFPRDDKKQCMRGKGLAKPKPKIMPPLILDLPAPEEDAPVEGGAEEQGTPAQ